MKEQHWVIEWYYLGDSDVVRWAIHQVYLPRKRIQYLTFEEACWKLIELNLEFLS